MCGILGYYLNSATIGNLNRFESALSSLGHRGPDDHGSSRISFDQSSLVLGHTRLAIIDLTEGGHQPMQSVDGRYQLIYNGEIYNYRELKQELMQLGHQFKTESDTEVLLAAWSEWQTDCIPKLNGMFAFAVVSIPQRTVTLVRDAFGIKPLFYRTTAGQFMFASELAALAEINADGLYLNHQRAYDYLVWGSYDDQSATLFRDVFSLQPGHWIEYDISSQTLREPERWWWPSIAERSDLTFAQAAAQFRELFLESVRLHLRSDVPLGAALSGGLDSSAIVCAMRRIEPDLPIHTFSFVAQGSRINEEKWIDLINQHVGAQAYKVVVTPSEIVEDMDDLIRAQGEPFMSTSIYAQYRVFRLARENGITVTLDGQGADESLAGYDGYPHGRVRSLLQQRNPVELMRFLRNWSRWPGRSLRQSSEILLQQASPEFLLLYLRKKRGSLATPAWIEAGAVKELGIEHSLPRLKKFPDTYRRGLASSLRSALAIRGLQALLRHGDRNSMRWSIESRVPFLSIPLVEFLLRLPESYLLSPLGETKHILRKSMRGIVPDAILDRKDKIGFSTPEAEWLRGCDYRPWIDDSIVRKVPFLKQSVLTKFVSGQLDGTTPYRPETWRILNFCRWMELFHPAI